MDWDLPQLRALAAIVEEGSLDGAAQALHLTPSAVSQRLKALEQSVGTVLVRRTRPVQPTAAGERVLVLARQVAALTSEYEHVAAPGGALPRVPLAVNADSLATWVLPALAAVSAVVSVEVVREDESRTSALLRDGTVMGAITSDATAVQGCSVTGLGFMRYRPMVARSLLERGGVSSHAGESSENLRDPAAVVRRLPVVVFDQHDSLQDEALQHLGIAPREVTRQCVPASAQFADAVRLGFGWGLVPEAQIAALGEGVVPLPGVPERDVPLFWQRWTLRLAGLDLVGDALQAAARSSLHHRR